MHSPSRKPCAICGAPLSVHDVVRGDVCGHGSCQQARLRQQLQTAAEQRRHTQQLAAHRQQQMLGDATIPAADPAPIVLLPANQRQLVNLPEKRKRLFRDYFTRCLSIAADRRASQVTRDAADANEEGENQFPVVTGPGTLTVLGNACGICRGQCCQQGGEHAFQRPEVVRQYMDGNPRLRPRDVLHAYLSRLPAVSYRDACVFQGRQGCVLSQQMRSLTCHEYLCEGLREINRIAHASGKPRVFVAAVDAQVTVRYALLDVDERLESDATRHWTVAKPDRRLAFESQRLQSQRQEPIIMNGTPA